MIVRERNVGQEPSCGRVGESSALPELLTAWQQANRDSGDSSALNAVLAQLGSFAHCGDDEIVKLAISLRGLLWPVAKGAQQLDEGLRTRVRVGLRVLERLVQRSEWASASAGSGAEYSAVTVYLLEPNERIAHDVAYHIEHFGYNIEVADDLSRLFDLIDSNPPDAVIMDLERSGSTNVADTIQQIREQADDRLPVLLLSEYGDMESRLQAVRAGADAYLLKPCDPHELIDQLDHVFTLPTQDPFHIAIVEDSSTQAAYCAALLKRAGMMSTVVDNPRRLLEVLNDNAIDLILMDMYMPYCNGMELARVVRQIPRYASIPIVYLSAETELDRQLDAMSLGADDFLTKPFDPGYLIRAVAIRAERARILRTFMLTDNLTGLLNHTRIKEQLYNEVARARRNGGKLCFAMLDIDHFKAVNDTYGHQIGDRVIKTLARVLQQRLRKTDHIGRYGGEEFAVILVDADADEAAEILNDVRVTFSEIRQMTSAGPFTVTFSGGIAAFPASGGAASLALDADRALYEAKNAGRNRILRAR